VTGGTDISLLEVSEASSIIQEAAHEDANIIFGAVVDPTMEGQIKITVIATGFDKPEMASRGAPSQTPVELHQYQGWNPEVPAGDQMPSRVSIVRRPAVELPARAAGDLDLDLATGTDGAGSSPIDVPAFLRPQPD